MTTAEITAALNDITNTQLPAKRQARADLVTSYNKNQVNYDFWRAQADIGCPKAYSTSQCKKNKGSWQEDIENKRAKSISYLTAYKQDGVSIGQIDAEIAQLNTSITTYQNNLIAAQLADNDVQRTLAKDYGTTVSGVDIKENQAGDTARAYDQLHATADDNVINAQADIVKQEATKKKAFLIGGLVAGALFVAGILYMILKHTKKPV